LAKVRLEDMRVSLLIGGTFHEVDLKDLEVASNVFSEAEILGLNVRKTILGRLRELAENERSLPGLRLTLEKGGDIPLTKDIFWLKKSAELVSMQVPVNKIDVSPDRPTILVGARLV
jgi:hypothetical protein